MHEKIKGMEKTGIVWTVVLCLLFMTFSGCKAREKIFTIGVVTEVSILSSTFEGFKTGMAELAYIEGKNVKYIYNGILKNDQRVVDAELKRLLSLDVDMLLTLGNNASLRAKEAVKGTDIPVLVSACVRPIESGLVESMSRPGDNITGVVVADSTAKALEWLKLITPGLKKVYLPYNPDDAVSIVSLIGLDDVASQLGIEFACQKVQSVEETVAAIKKLPKDVDAIFRIPSPTLDPRNSELSRAAIEKGLPMGARVSLDKDVLITFGADLYEIGRQTARLAHHIRAGVRPSDLPIEISEASLTINLKTAEKIGLEIPDNILLHAKTVIR